MNIDQYLRRNPHVLADLLIKHGELGRLSKKAEEARVLARRANRRLSKPYTENGLGRLGDLNELNARLDRIAKAAPDHIGWLEDLLAEINNKLDDGKSSQQIEIERKLAAMVAKGADYSDALLSLPVREQHLLFDTMRF